MKDPKKTLTEFVEQLVTGSIGSSLWARATQFDVFQFEGSGFNSVVSGQGELLNVKQNFDFILADLPLALPIVEASFDKAIKARGNRLMLLYLLRKLEEGGKLVAVLEPSFLTGGPAAKFREMLANEGLFLQAAFNPPANILAPHASVRPVVCVFSHKKRDNVFLGEISEDNHETLVSNFTNEISTNYLTQGIIQPIDEFSSFAALEYQLKVEALKAKFKEYQEIPIAEVAEVRATKDTFEEGENCVYVPTIGTSLAITDLSAAKLKHQNYLQVTLDPKKVLAGYAASFYRSGFGQFIIKSHYSGSVIPKLTKGSYEASVILAPNIPEQLLIVHTGNKLTELQNTIKGLQNDLSVNPQNASSILERFNDIEKPLKQLSRADEIIRLVNQGEGKKLEFKETFTKNIHTGQRDKVNIETGSLKNIVGFLNADGGTLLIGIADDGTIKGVENDFYKSDDKYKLHFKNALKEKIGAEFYGFIDYELVAVAGKKILMVECKQSTEPCFLDGKDFYVRTNPATDKLEGKKQHEYIRSHFTKK